MILARPLPFVLLFVSLAGCAATPTPPVTPPPMATGTAAPAAAAPAAGPELPPLLRGIGLTPEQVEAVIRINADLESKAEPFVSSVNELGHSVAGAARQCKGDTPFIETDAARVVREGEDVRKPVLDAVQRVHHVLTPAQRRIVSERLVESDDWAKRERRNSSRTRELGPALDLSTMQLVKMLVKAGVLWSSFADRAEPWRNHYRTAITNFAREDFDVHHEPVAAAPAVAFTVDFVRAGLRQIIPLLEPKQCEVLGNLIDQKLDEAAARAAERAAARARALEHR